MTILIFFMQNIVYPPILFFLLGCFGGFIKSNLSIPESISCYLSLYLMMAIGFKGGVALIETQELNSQVICLLVIGLLIGFLQPFIAFFLLRITTTLDRVTAAAVSAHYGSISVVTFVTAVSFLQESGIKYASYIVSFLLLWKPHQSFQD